MIIVITFKDKETGEILVSHGYDTDTGRIVIMPEVHPTKVGAVFDYDNSGEWILN